MFCSLGKKRGSRKTQNFNNKSFEPSVHWYYSTYGSHLINARNNWRLLPNLHPLYFSILSWKISHISSNFSSATIFHPLTRPVVGFVWPYTASYIRRCLFTTTSHILQTLNNQHNQNSTHNHGEYKLLAWRMPKKTHETWQWVLSSAWRS